MRTRTADADQHDRPHHPGGWSIRLLEVTAALVAVGVVVTLLGGSAHTVVLLLAPVVAVASVHLPCAHAAVLGAVVGLGGEAALLATGGEPSVVRAGAVVLVAVVFARIFPLPARPPRTTPQGQPVSNR